jgi:hypothetical protein
VASPPPRSRQGSAYLPQPCLDTVAWPPALRSRRVCRSCAWATRAGRKCSQDLVTGSDPRGCVGARNDCYDARYGGDQDAQAPCLDRRRRRCITLVFRRANRISSFGSAEWVSLDRSQIWIGIVTSMQWCAFRNYLFSGPANPLTDLDIRHGRQHHRAISTRYARSQVSTHSHYWFLLAP